MCSSFFWKLQIFLVSFTIQVFSWVIFEKKEKKFLMSLKKHLHEIRKRLPLPKLEIVFYTILVMIGIITGVVIAQITITFRDLSDIKPLESYSSYAVPTKVYDVKGKLIAEFYREKREIISYKDMPQSLIYAIVAIEDNKFFQHRGFNLLAMIRGAFIDPLLGKRARGGSTLTQQLAKRLYTSRGKKCLSKDCRTLVCDAN